MHTIVLGLVGALLGVAIGRCQLHRLVRYAVLASSGLAGFVGVLALNGALAQQLMPELSGNPSLGAGVFLLGLAYCERRYRRAPAETAIDRATPATGIGSAEPAHR